MLDCFLSLDSSRQQIVVNALEAVSKSLASDGLTPPDDDLSWPLAEEIARLVLLLPE